MLWGIDISRYQEGIDLRRVRGEGYDFCIIKASQGTRTDPQFARHLDQARSAGLLVAAYHYQEGNVPAAAQAEHIARTVPRDVGVILDLEKGGGTVALTRDITQRLRDKGFHVPLTYVPRWYWQQIGSPDLRGLPPLWYSRYPANGTGAASQAWARNAAWLNTMWGGYGGIGVEILQFSESGTVAGRTPVDMNAYRGSREQLAALFGGAPRVAPPAPGGIESMAFTDSFTDWAKNRQTVESWMNNLDKRVAELHGAVLGLQQSRIIGPNGERDKNTTNAANLWFDAGAWSNQALGHVVAIRALLANMQGIDPAAVADALRPALAEVVGPVVAESVRAALGEDNEAQAEAIVTELAQRLGGAAA